MTDCYGNNKAYIPLSLNKTAMQPLLSLSVFWLLPLALTLEENSPLDCVPRRSVPYHSECCYLLCNLGLQYVNSCWLKWCGFGLIDFYSVGDNAHVFREEGVFNYSTMLLREDLDLLVLGAREAVYALDLKDISKKLASVRTPLLIM